MPAQTWIRATLKERGLKLKDVAAALEITPPRVTDIMKGMREVQADEILPLATLLGMTSKSLLASLALGEKTNAGRELDGPALNVLGALTGTGDLIPPSPNATISSVPVPPDAESADGLYCYIMGDDSLEQEIRQGSLIIAGDPRLHFFPMVPGSIFIVDIGSMGGMGDKGDNGSKITARQYFKSPNGEDWLVPLPANHNPHYESWRFSMLPAELEQANVAAMPGSGTETLAHKVVRTTDIVAVVMWVHRRYTPDT